MKNGGRLGAALLALCLLLCGCACGAAQREGAASAAEAVGRAARPAPTPAPAREAAVGSVPRTTPEPTPAPTPTPAPEALLLQNMTLEEKVGQLFFVRCPETDGAAIGEVVATYEAENVGTVLKHFPGYGNAADSHAGVVYDDRDLAAFEDGAFLPFKAGIDAGADCVLVTHNIVPCVDGEAPASLSAAWHAVLRDTLGFSGVIITDDLSMGGVTDYTEGASAAVAAVLAGNDMLCCTDFETQIPAVLRAVEDGTISEARIDESVLRILRWKLERGIIAAQTE